MELLAQGYRVVALDSLINSHPEAIARIRRIAGGELAFVRGDVCSLETLEQLFDAHRMTASSISRRTRPWAIPSARRWPTIATI